MNKIIFNKIEVTPSKLVCIGRNYIEHIKELNNELPSSMVFFMKANSSITDKLSIPNIDSSCHYEAEISFLIEKDKIVGLAFGLDLTLRDIQTELKNKGLPWERAKSFDASAVFSDFIEFKDDISKLGIELYINNELKQKADYSMMIHKPKDIIKEFKTFSSFEDGDILMSGTPKGVGKLIKGDVFLGKILYENEVILKQEFVVS
ncbi:fumarylacetoacetate hydrolase family protein [Aliarcobacter thereius]|uniref:Fumarylacetoacetate hydrolase family protein n=2 Tax=Aliarcobacter thereius TaxID=544718 RepID=A0A1C0B7S5_9BACT|nr:fumarylacetoacetate hydrolase family protein [Aliarcobacter thereius]OCL94062.1 Fumarylpyruvate hydrolase [Aliarcobacter thereius]OCL95456.1 Fumarylpyruvate hydrolase [Aliarcobacter thereius LMG 24486]OCL99650.1 Fumarylpyruvate hydrolase [Aliarcobacter thereius]QBF16556.1 fumarylacetoacetate hydrolase family protein [Aliarcobacter thereius LMG 24486]TLS73021.1 fumarylacetoacetate hydrolase family protein [Aliarcobacter thereius]